MYICIKTRADSSSFSGSHERQNDMRQSTQPTTLCQEQCLLCALMRGHVKQYTVCLFTKTSLLAAVITVYDVQCCMSIPHQLAGLGGSCPQCFHHQPLIPGHLEIEKITQLYWPSTLVANIWREMWADFTEKMSVSWHWFRACLSVTLWHINHCVSSECVILCPEWAC